MQDIEEDLLDEEEEEGEEEEESDGSENPSLLPFKPPHAPLDCTSREAVSALGLISSWSWSSSMCTS